MHRFQKNRHTVLFTAPALMVLLFGAMACSVLDSDGDKDGINQPGTPSYPQPYRWPWVSPDGSKLLFSRNAVSLIYRSGGYIFMPDSSGIWLAEPDGSNMRLLIQGIYLDFPSLSPDGQWLLFGAGAQIYKAPFAGDSVDVAGIVQLTTEGRNFFPAWSPDGEWITYDRSLADETGPGGVWKMRTDGSKKKPVFGGAFPTWHPDGESIIAVVGVSATSMWKRFIRYYPFDDRPSETLDAAVDNDNRYPKYSPDGSKIVFQSQLRIPNGGVQVMLMDSDGGNLTQLTTDGCCGFEPAWAHNGRIVYVHFNSHRFDINNGTFGT